MEKVYNTNTQKPVNENKKARFHKEFPKEIYYPTICSEEYLEGRFPFVRNFAKKKVEVRHGQEEYN